MHGSIISAAVALAMAASGSAAIAPKPAPAPSPLVYALDRCRQIGDAAQRLACFDSASAALIAATQSGDVSVVDRAQLRAARRSLFGFAMPRLPFFAGDTSAGEATGSLDSTIKSVRELSNGRFQLVLADAGAVWETTESYLNFDDPRPGQKIKIKRGPLGSYFLIINNQRGVKGKRVG